ncbi:MAG TPA: tetratricopeptide repeat protein [Chitinophagaceae bacterium]|nr:tetratricopeptide repeat protein [Chitinophagaceae bacterium]
MDRILKLKALLETSPADPFLKHALGLEYIKMGEENAARDQFESLLEKDPTYVGTYYHLAKLLERTGDTSQAIVTYEKGMEEAKKAGETHAYNELKAAYEELMF